MKKKWTDLVKPIKKNVLKYVKIETWNIFTPRTHFTISALVIKIKSRIVAGEKIISHGKGIEKTFASYDFYQW